MSIARQHNEWLLIVPNSGPFLSLPVLSQAFPQGLDVHDSDHARRLRMAFDEWDNNQLGNRPDPAIHRAWIKFVLGETLDYNELLAEGQAIPQTLKSEVAEYGETLRPDWIVNDPATKKARLLVQVYPRSQSLTKPVASSRWKTSPDTRMMQLLHDTGIRLGIVTNGDYWMLVNAPKNETTGYVSWYSNLWLEEKDTLRAFRTLLCADRFFNVPEDQTLEALLDKSADDQQEVTDQLGYQVRKAVEVLIQALDKADQDHGRKLLANVDEKVLYESALTVMMRLVFLFCAEERELLLLGDDLYDKNYAVSTLREQLRVTADQYGEEILGLRYDAWTRLLTTFRAVYAGAKHDRLKFPAYGGSLFNPDRFPFLEGRKLGTSWKNTEATPLPVSNRTVLHLLEALQVLRTKIGGTTEARKLSFRALDIEQIGHVYEGLLDHTAKRATEPMLGLAGTRDKEPEIKLAELEKLAAKGEKEFLKFLKEETGRSESALKKALQFEDRQGDSNDIYIDTKSLPSEVAEYRELIEQVPDLLRRRSSGGTPLPLPLGVEAQIEELEAALRKCLANGREIATAAGHQLLKRLQQLRSATSQSPRKQPKKTKQQVLYDPVEGQLASRFRTACQDADLWKRVKPFAGLVRLDDMEYPVVVTTGSVFVTAGTDRRSSGTHYTPKSLTEPIVQYTLEPLVNVGPAEGLPKEQWKLRSAKELLDLKICDMACGSGAFLVQACRYMAARLLEAWEAIERDNPGQVRILPHGELADAHPSEQPIPLDPDERQTYALRIVAQRCLYGVDKNPLAAEMAKLSLWLLTLAKDKPFEFLDHAIRCGDSLVGIHTLDQLYHFNMEGKPGQTRIITEAVQNRIKEAVALRQQITEMLANTVEDVAAQEAKLNEANEKLDRLKCVADMLIAAEFVPGSASDKQTARDNAAIKVAVHFPDSDLPKLRQEGQKMLDGQVTFHWPLEFPEAMVERGGFDAFVGNPPFMGGQKITGVIGSPYRDFIVASIGGNRKGSADLSVFFLLRAVSLLGLHGVSGLVLTSAVAEGDNREVGMDHLIACKLRVVRADTSKAWPGKASVIYSGLWVSKGNWKGQCVLNEQNVDGISSYLTTVGEITGNPYRLLSNSGKSFIGHYVLGMGFLIAPEVSEGLISRDKKNADVLFPFLNGSELNATWNSAPTRWVINFRQWPLSREGAPKGYAGQVAEDYPDCISIVRSLVKPERDKNNRPRRKERWWLFGDYAPSLEVAIEQEKLLFAISMAAAKHIAFCRAPKGALLSHTLAVLSLDRWAEFGVISSSLHDCWTRQYTSYNLKLPRYIHTDCFLTYPFPVMGDSLDKLADEYHSFRSQVMKDANQGSTETYNRFHDTNETSTDIAKLRELHVEMDNAVAAAYGWNDLNLGHGFHETKQGVRYTISEPARREVLARLLKLNHERYAEEVKQGLHEKKKVSRGKANKTESQSFSSDQSTLFE
jgi:hypothetical protein